MLTQLLGLGIIESMRVMYNNPVVEKKKASPVWYKLVRVLFYLSVVGTFIGLGLWKQMFLYWIIPFLTWTQFANRLRRLAEHSGIEGKEPDFQIRTTVHGPLARLFLAPNNVAYHIEHHILPGVPQYNLPDLHHEIMKQEDIRQKLHVSNSYSEVLKEMVV